MKSLELNTKKSGKLTVFTYKQGRKYVSVCLELDIEKEGADPLKLTQGMIEAVTGHVETICKEGLSDDLLNRPAPKEHWVKFLTLADSSVCV